MRLIVSLFIFLFIRQAATAQFVFPESIERNHPRLVSSNLTKNEIQTKIGSSPDLQADYIALKSGISKYVNQYKTEPDWLSSRLQMYWKSHATEVYLKGEYYDHASGHAPVPTVRFTGQRDYVTDYKTPSLADSKPYLEDERGLYLQHKKTNTWEWVPPYKTGRIIENSNERILQIARDAALVYYIEGDEDYAKLAMKIFDVYMHGLYYRKEPIDLNKSNIQNITGITSFQVIKENIVDEVTQTYDFLFEFLQSNKKEQIPIYTASFKNLAEIIIKNGVPDNNWNLHQANYVIQIALVLEENKTYEDGKGCQYYLNRVFNETEARQWSVKDVLAYGYDQNNGVWNESAGYALSVAKGFTELARGLQLTLGLNLIPAMPIIPKAVNIMPQYLYPNGSIVAFGDSHYGPLDKEPFLDLISNAQQFNNREQEEQFTSLYYLIHGNDKQHDKGKRNALNNFLFSSEAHLDSTIKKANSEDYMTNSFYAPNVSWVAMRNGLDKKNGLMISQVASLGNHAHANGIAMELYGKGFILAPEGGRGSSYFRPDYKDYYAQFPAHNTVSVNGKSKYNIMRSYFPFQVNALYPASEKKSGYYPNINFSDLYFHEPSTDADQNRQMAIIRTSQNSGYYVDIFRSKGKSDSAQFHDYFYHNLGQGLAFNSSEGKPLDLKPSAKLNSKNGLTKAYDYFTDESSFITQSPFKASFSLILQENHEVKMDMWFNGNDNREIFSVKAPPSEAFRHGVIPKEIEKLPLLTTVVRQHGEAWQQPFVAVYESSDSYEPSTITAVSEFKTSNSTNSFVGLAIKSMQNRTDYIFSSDVSGRYNYQDIDFEGTYGVFSNDSATTTLFLGAGEKIAYNGYSITVLGKKSSSAALEIGNTLKLSNDDAIRLTVPDTYGPGEVYLNIGYKALKGARIKEKQVAFYIPQTEYQDITISLKK